MRPKFLEAILKVVTPAYIHQHKTKNGGWTKKQLAVLGIAWPPRSGWVRRVEGKVLTAEEAKIFEGGNQEFVGSPQMPEKKINSANVAVTGPNVVEDICDCDVPPWEDCEHTEYAAHQAMLEMLSMK